MNLSFYKRVVLLLCGLVFLIQLFNLSAVLTTIAQDVRTEMHEDLTDASQLVDQFVQRRADLLLTSAEVLAADFGFRAAIASGDEATILSALTNNVTRIDADLATFVTLDGRMVGRSASIAADRISYLELANEADQNGTTTATLVIDGFAREVVGVPVKAPLTIGWLILGFSLDNSIAKSFSSQVGMQVTFAAGSADLDYYGSSFGTGERSAIRAAMKSVIQTNSGPVTTILGEEFLTQIVPISNNQSRVVILLHTSLDAALASYRGVRKRLLVFMAMSLIAALTLGLWFARGVTRPVELLSIAARQISEGNYQTVLAQSEDSQRSDEFGQLIKTFDQMQSGIADREAKISRHAYYDDFTQLPNRRMALKHLESIVAQQQTEQATVGVILLGVNRYKQIVETLGHTVGEQMVQALATRLSGVSQQFELLARVSTDEFLILLRDCDYQQCHTVSLKTLAISALPITLNDAELVPNLSAGIVMIPQHASSAEAAIRRASIALSEAIDTADSIATYQDGRDESHRRRLSIVAELKKAVESDELTVYFQPKINMQSKQVFSVEALVRWIHPERGFMAPDEFIGLAESSGNIGLITQWVLKAVIEQLADWKRQGIHLKAAVNLSALDLQDKSLFYRIQTLLEANSVPASSLILEVTESAMMRDTACALAVLAKMRNFGLTISIDDFGTGYSSLAKLKDLPIDELKIDKAFVTDIEADSTKSLIIKAIIDLGHSMDLTVISEGVETQAEWDLLETLGNDVVQGYLIARPMPATEFLSWWYENYPDDTRTAA